MSYVFIIILQELLRLYILGLWAMLLMSVFNVVSWSVIVAATSMLQVVFLPLILGLVANFIAETTGHVMSACEWAFGAIKRRFAR